MLLCPPSYDRYDSSDEEFIVNVTERLKRLLEPDNSNDPQPKSRSIILNYIKNAKKEQKIEDQNLKPLTVSQFNQLSEKYVESMITTIPDCAPFCNSLFHSWVRLMSLGKAIGHVNIDRYGLRVIHHVNPAYINACQRALEYLCNFTNSPEQTFSIPTTHAIYRLLDHTTYILALDEGIGYWASTLALAGADVVLGNSRKESGQKKNNVYPAHNKSTYELLRARDKHEISQYHKRTLLLCPGLSCSIARHLKAFKGNMFIYIGDRNDATDMDYYLKAHQNKWNEIERVELPIIWHSVGAYRHWLCVFERTFVQ